MMYSTNPECRDEAFDKEVHRNSLGFGADDVLGSGLVLLPPRSLSELLRNYEGPLLVYHGTLDLLNSSTDRPEKIKAEYQRVRLRNGSWAPARMTRMRPTFRGPP